MVMTNEGMKLNEHQRQAVDFLDIAIRRLYQEGLGPEDVVYLFLKITNDDLRSAGLKLFLGSVNQ